MFIEQLLCIQQNVSCESTMRIEPPFVAATVTGWWLTYPSEKYEFVRLDHHPVPIGANKIHVPNHQPGIITIINHH